MSSHSFQYVAASGIIVDDGAFEPYTVSAACTEHVVSSEDVIEYFGGVFVAHCTECNQRISIDRIPGGSLLARARALQKIVDDGNVESIHKMEFSVLKSFVRGDLDAVRETAAILESIEEAL